MDTIETAIEQLAVILRESHPEGLTSALFNETIEKARRRLESEVDMLRRRQDFERIFDTQLCVLQERGMPKQSVEELRNQKRVVISKALRMKIDERNTPFAPVTPLVYIGYYGLVSLVRNGDEACGVSLHTNVAKIVDWIDTPETPYYIYDVHWGTDMVGKSETLARQTFETQGRLPLTAVETLCLCSVSFLPQHGVWAFGSYYDRNAVSHPRRPTPLIVLEMNQPRRPWFSWSVIPDPIDLYVPSCVSRGDE